MRSFLITSTKFTGEARLVYNEKQTLCMLDCTKSDMDEDTITAFKRVAPATIHQLQNGRCFSADTVVVESDFVVSFKRFYDDYPLKRNRYRAEICFNKLNKSNQVKAFYSLHGYKKYLTKTQIFAMGADRYLTDHHFETEWEKIKQ